MQPLFLITYSLFCSLVDGSSCRLFSALSNSFPFFSYQPLPTEEEKELKETLQDIIGHGKKVKLEQKVCSDYPNDSIVKSLFI